MSLEMAPISWSLGDVKYKARVVRSRQKPQNPKQPCRLPSPCVPDPPLWQGEEIDSMRETSRARVENVMRLKFHFSNNLWLRKHLKL